MWIGKNHENLTKNPCWSIDLWFQFLKILYIAFDWCVSERNSLEEAIIYQNTISKINLKFNISKNMHLGRMNASKWKKNASCYWFSHSALIKNSNHFLKWNLHIIFWLKDKFVQKFSGFGFEKIYRKYEKLKIFRVLFRLLIQFHVDYLLH